MTRSPAAHRLVTKKARQERAWRRAMYRMPLRWVTGIDPQLSDEEITSLRPGPLMVLPEPRGVSMCHLMPDKYRRLAERAEAPHAARPRDFGVTAEEWAEHMRKVGKAYGYTAGEYSAGKRNEEEAFGQPETAADMNERLRKADEEGKRGRI